MQSDIPPLTTRRELIAGLGGVAVLAGVGTVSADEHQEPDVTVTVRSFEFDPETVEISVGDTVQWVWEEGSHNVSPTEMPDDATWDGDDDQTYGAGHEYQHTFEVPGTYEYICQPHSSAMQGTVEVTESQTSDADATVTFTGQRTRGQTVVVDSVRMDDGGFVTIHDSSLLEGEVLGSVVGVSEYLDAGSYETVTVELDDPLEEGDTLIAMPHRDTNGNEAYDFLENEGGEDGPYLTLEDEAVIDDAEVTIGPAAETSFSDQTSSGDSLTVDSVRMNAGGFVTIHDSSLLDGEVLGSVVDVSEYLDPGTHEDVTIELEESLEADDTLIAMPHRDTNGNETYDFLETEGSEDGPYLTAVPARKPTSYSWEEARKLDWTPHYTIGMVPQARKRSAGRAVRQPAPESGDGDRVPPTPARKPPEKARS